MKVPDTSPSTLLSPGLHGPLVQLRRNPRASQSLCPTHLSTAPLSPLLPQRRPTCLPSRPQAALGLVEKSFRDQRPSEGPAWCPALPVAVAATVHRLGWAPLRETWLHRSPVPAPQQCHPHSVGLTQGRAHSCDTQSLSPALRP
uniref:Uncharacterized protein n=1 Tax=Molossus molossus TaxID=27622 RepID=A0A7J8FZV8_MOLMO|nr:hypothetical protein HJG59_008286 [Molossus molossus]